MLQGGIACRAVIAWTSICSSSFILIQYCTRDSNISITRNKYIDLLFFGRSFNMHTQSTKTIILNGNVSIKMKKLKTKKNSKISELLKQRDFELS